MAFVTRKITRTSQPQEIVGLSDEYLGGSVIGLNFGASINANLAQYLHNRLIPRASDGVKISKDGRGIYCTDTTRSLLDNDFGAPMVTSDGAGTGDFSIAGVISPKSAATRSPVLHMRYNTAAPFTSLFVLVNGYYQDNLISGSNEAGTLYIGSFHGVTNYNARGLKVTGIVNGQTLNFVYNRYASGYQELWVNGALVSSGTTVVNPVLAPGTQQFAIGGFAQAAGFPYVDPTNLIYVSNKAIDGAAVSANPWQILDPLEETIWISDAVAGGGATYTLTGDGASLTLTGQDAGLIACRRIAADSSSLTLAGQDSGLISGRRIVADNSALTLASQDASLIVGRRLVADTSSLSIAGQDADLIASRVLVADSSAITLAGQDTTLTYTPVGGPTYTLSAASSTMTLAWQDAALIAGRRLVADSAAFDMALQDAILSRGYVMEAASGDFSLAGQDAALIASRRLAADSYFFTLVGQDAALTYSGAVAPPVAGAMAGRRMAVDSTRPARIQTSTRPAR